MQIGMIGLGKMGANMTQRLLNHGVEVVVTDLDVSAVQKASDAGATPATSIENLVETLSSPRVVWVMVPAGEATEATINVLSDQLSAGDVLIDGGNSNYNETIRRAEMLQSKGILMIDAGTSGGVWGLQEGYSLMVGGIDEAIAIAKPIFEALAPAPDRGWGHVGGNGAGHFVKMIHNGIEYGMMQAFAEGFEILKSKKEMDLDVHQIAEIWQHGSVVRSWLLDLIVNALADDADLADIKGWVNDSGEGRWTVFEAINQDVPAPVITASLMARFVSRQDESYAAKLLAAMRNQFGGHAVKKAE
jgi:6-phosphogluconate dehydrogenase